MSYARGPKAVGLCQRSGKKLLRRDMLEDEYMEGLLVAPEWWEPRHPQEDPVDTNEYESIYKPAPDPDRLALSVMPDGLSKIVVQMTGRVGYEVVDLPSFLALGGPYTASLTDTSVTITVERTGGGTACSAIVTFTDGVAVGGLDYTPTAIPVSFGVGEMTKDIEVPLLAPTYNAEVVAVGGLYSHYPLSETSGTTAADISGNARTLSLTSGAITWGTPRVNISGVTSATFAGTTALERANTAALLGNVHLAVDGWDRMSSIPAGAAIFYSIGGPSDDSSGNPNWQIMCRAINNGAGGMYPSIFWESGGGGSNHLVNFLTLEIPLNAEFYWKFGRRPSTGEWYCQINNDIAYEAYVTPPDGGSTSVVTVGNTNDQDVGMLGRMSNVAVYLGDGNIPAANRYDRWKLGAQRDFTATLGTPVGATITDDEAVVTLREEGYVLAESKAVNIVGTAFGVTLGTPASPIGTVVTINAAASDRIVITKPTVAADPGLTWNAWSAWDTDLGNGDGLSYINRHMISDQSNSTLVAYGITIKGATAAALQAAVQVDYPMLLTGSTQYKFWSFDSEVVDNRLGLSLRVERYELKP